MPDRPSTGHGTPLESQPSLYSSLPDSYGILPEGVRVYAIGDIHGRLDLLDQLLRLISQDADNTAAPNDTWLIYLGDYVDRGPESRTVVDRLLAGPPPGFQALTLCGNHESMLLQFLANPLAGVNWMMGGGAATLLSYGVDFPQGVPLRQRLQEAHAKFLTSLPPEHFRFLRQLPAYAVYGGYAFVHAGVRPGIPLPEQRTDDLLWIRDEFLASSQRHERLVVHGHTISSAPQSLANRIGIDTGAFATGKLTAVVLEKNKRRFLQTNTGP